MPDLSTQRHFMVKRQIEARGVRDAAVLDAMRTVPRERFVPSDMREFAYDDGPLPIGEGQTISQPFIVALMIEAASLHSKSRVLEVGAGSGYATAVIAQIADEVFAIERIELLGRQLEEKFEQLGYHNAHFRIGDGSKGWPEQAPFDAILVAAGAPAAPEALKQQLAIGGRLIVPVLNGGPDQRLRRITRHTETRFEEEDLGGVRFVPLIGEEGWADEGASGLSVPARTGPNGPTAEEIVAKAAEPLDAPDSESVARAADRFANRKIVLLGEATHGTSEFYQARAAITRRLIEKHGFNIVAVEADWPDAAAINRFVRHHPPRKRGYKHFGRFPTWMWANTDIEALMTWMRDRNEGLKEEAQAGFYGLDIYNMHGSIATVLDYLDDVDPKAAAVARERYGCLTPWQKNPATYGRAALSKGYAECEQAVVEQCRELLEHEVRYSQDGDEGFLDAAQSARLVKAAEKYYRIMYYGGAESWNFRDSHMFETLEHLLEAKGPSAKAVVWAHNSHIGDARQTEMGQMRGEHNLGQLCRERWGDEVALVGFGTHGGTVAAASSWDGEMEVKRIRPALSGSHEALCHKAGIRRFLLDFRSGQHPSLEAILDEPMLQRFIGVIYRPETERQSHYAQAMLARQYDAYLWFDKTRAIEPLLRTEHHEGVPETYPFSL